MKRKAVQIFLLLACILGIGGGLSEGQNITSTLVGQVNDSAGSGVPGAKVTVTNIGTGIATAGTTSPSGSYSIVELQPGNYSVKIESPGFATAIIRNVAVESSQTARADVALKIGAASESVQVSGDVPVLTTDSPSIEGTLETQQIRDLPAAYLTVVSLMQTVPGLDNPQPSSPSNPQMAGTTHWGAVNYSLNGVSVNDQVNGGAAYAYVTANQLALDAQNLPSTDTLQEFKVTNVNANAEYRDVASVSMLTKQGTNQFHGDVYEFLQNADLNANTLILNSAGQPRAKGNINQFGGGMSGPIFKDKAFFFFAPTYLRQITSGTVQLILPSTAMAGGNFSALPTQLYNPFTGQEFTGNQIPSNLITSQAATLLKYLPTPNVAGSLGLPSGAPNYVKSIPVLQNSNAYVGRVDYRLSHSDSMYGFYSYSVGLPWNVFLGGPPQHGNGTNYGFRDQATSASETHIFSPTLLNDFRGSWFIHSSFRFGQNQDFNPQSLFPTLTPGANRGLPTMTASGYSTLVNDVGNTVDSSGYVSEFTDNLTKVYKNHTIKAGVDESGYKTYNRSGFGPLGSFAFSGVWTGNKGWPGQPQSQGNAFADFLLGTANTAALGTVGSSAVLYNRDWEAYGQDTWQVSQRLTMYYGLRYMYQTPWNVKDNAYAYFDLNNNKLALAENSATPVLPVNGNQATFAAYSSLFETTQSIGLPLHFMQPSKGNWAPRFGFAYRPFDHTVVRGGYGIYYNFLIEAQPGQYASNLPFGQVTLTATSKLPGVPTAPYQPDITFANPFGTAAAGITANPTAVRVQRDLKNAMTQQWSLTLEQQFAQKWTARISYVGSQTQHLAFFLANLNVPVNQIPNESAQLQRPRQPWGAINSIESGAVQSFGQMQLEVLHRFSNGSSFQAEYSWTRSLDDVENTGSAQRYYFPSLDYGNSTGVRTHDLVFNYLYELPFGHGHRLLGQSNAVTNALVGGWEVSGISTYATGLPFSMNFAVPSNYIGWAGGRANRIPGIPLYIKGKGHDINDGVPWVNPAAFGPPLPWTYGTSGRNMLYGPGLWNWDMSALKTIPVATERVKATFRADFFDVFNHFNTAGADATVASTQYGGLARPTSGMIFGGSGNRVIQLGLRVSF